MMHYPFIAILAIYLVATLFYILRLLTGKTQMSGIALRITLMGALLQLAVLTAHLILAPKPLVLSYLEYFQLSSLFLALVFVVLCFSKRFYGSGPLFITLIDVFCILSLTLKSPYAFETMSQGSWFLFFHLVAIFLSLPVFSLALITALMFLLSEWQIKNKKFDGIVARFPSLESLDRIHYKALYFGFALFTLVIVTGAGYSKIVKGYHLTSDVKQIVSFVSWLIFAIILKFRVRQGWQGHKGILLSLVGFVSIIFLFMIGIR